MPPRAAAAAEEGVVDIAADIDQFWRAYRKNCHTLEITLNPQMKALYEAWNDENKPITKVSIHPASW